MFLFISLDLEILLSAAFTQSAHFLEQSLIILIVFFLEFFQLFTFFLICCVPELNTVLQQKPHSQIELYYCTCFVNYHSDINKTFALVTMAFVHLICDLAQPPVIYHPGFVQMTSYIQKFMFVLNELHSMFSSDFSNWQD